MLVDYTSKPWRNLPSRAPAFTPDPSWTLTKIRNVQTEHETGYFYRSALMARWMMRDGRLSTVTETRLNGLFGLPFCIETPDEKPTARERKAAQAFESLWTRIMPEKTAREVLEWLVLLGFCLCQVHWYDDPRVPARWVPRLKVWNPNYCYYDQTKGSWHVISSQGVQQITPGDGQWVLFSLRDSMPWAAGAVLSLSIPILIRSFSWQDWSNFNETLGQTFLKAIVPSWAEKSTVDASGTPSKDLFLEQVQGIGRDNKYLTCEIGSDGSKFDASYESPKGEGSQSFERAQANASTEITTRILGQNLTTEVGDKGSYGATKSHEDVRQDYKEADSETLSTDLREQLTKPWAHYNFGDAELAPWAHYDPTPPEDKQSESTTLDQLAKAVGPLIQGLQGSGQQLDVVALYERFGLPMKAGEIETKESPETPTEDDERSYRNIVPWKRRMILRGQRALGVRQHPQER